MTRLLKRKRVPILTGDNLYDANRYVDLPVLYETAIIGSRGQEFNYRFHNDSTTKLRTTRVKKVGAAIGLSVSFDRYINTERIISMAYHGNIESGLAWRTDKKFNNLDPAPKQPDGSNDPRHLGVHYVRFYRNNDLNSTDWIDVEYIDGLSMLGTNAQEYRFRMQHPTASDYAAMANDGRFGQFKTDDGDPYQPMIGFCNQSLDLLDVEFNEAGKPVNVRLDPLQNIVNVHGATTKRPYLYYFLFTQIMAHTSPLVNGSGTWSGPFKYIYFNYYSTGFDPPDPEVSDPYPQPPAIELFGERTYSEATFLNGPADWLNASGNWFKNTGVYWDNRLPGDVTAFVPNYGYEYPNYSTFIGIPANWQTALPDGYIDPVPDGYDPSDYPFV